MKRNRECDVVEYWRQSNPLLTSRIVNYVVKRQNKDGGYTFAQGAESNAQDTYYGLAILSSLNSPLLNVEKTASFVKETRLDTIYPIYYTAKALELLGKGIDENLKNHLIPILKFNRFFGSINFYSEVSSEFTITYMSLELARMLKLKIDRKEVAGWLLSVRNIDGGFGSRGLSNINSTYYAIASLKLLDVSLKDPQETLKFVKACEKPEGGFTVIPINFTPYMEYTFYGMMTLDLVGEKSRYPRQTIDWILSCQNGNGGFARSDLGISSFVDTYFAVTLLLKLA